MKRWWAPWLLLAGLGVLFFAALAVQPAGVLYSEYSDFLTQHVPYRYFLVRSWQQTGELPLWCPYMFCGQPFIHDVQVSAFYPPHAPLYLLPERHLGAAMSWLIVLHVIAAGWTMYAYARWRGLTGTAAVAAAVGYMFAGKWLLHILAGGHYVVVPLAWLPLVLLLLEQAIRTGAGLRALGAGAVFACIVLATHPQVTLYAGLFVASWTMLPVLDAFAERRTQPDGIARLRRLTARWLGFGVCTGLAAGLLSAVQLLPAMEATRASSRTLGAPAVPAEVLTSSVRTLLGLVGPTIPTESSWIWEERGGFGVLWLALACCAPLLDERRIVRLQAGLALFWLLFGLGGVVLVQWVPGFHLFRLPSRALLLLALPVALLAGTATQALFAMPTLPAELLTRGRQFLLKFSFYALVPLACYGAMLYFRGRNVQLAPYWLATVVTVPAAWWLMGKTAAERPAWLGGAWVAVLVADLWALALPLVEVRPEAEVFARSASVRFLQERSPDHGRVYDVNPMPPWNEDSSWCLTPLWPNSALVFAVEPVRGYNPVDVLRTKEFLQFLTNRDDPLQALSSNFTIPGYPALALENAPLTNLLGVRYLLQPAAMPLERTIPDAAARPHWRSVFSDPDPRGYSFVPTAADATDSGLRPLPPYVVYENSAAMPRAFVVHQAQPAPERAAMLSTLTAADLRQSVLIEDLAEPLVHPKPALATTAEIVEYLPNRVTVRVSGSAAGWLVLADVWFPGWTCTIDREPTPIHRANFLFRAVAIPAGEHEVTFTFAPRSYAVGLRISLFTILVLAGCWMLNLVLFRILVFSTVSTPSE